MNRTPCLTYPGPCGVHEGKRDTVLCCGLAGQGTRVEESATVLEAWVGAEGAPRREGCLAQRCTAAGLKDTPVRLAVCRFSLLNTDVCAVRTRSLQAPVSAVPAILQPLLVGVRVWSTRQCPQAMTLPMLGQEGSRWVCSISGLRGSFLPCLDAQIRRNMAVF